MKRPSLFLNGASPVAILECATYLALLLLVAAIAQRVGDGIVVQAFARHMP